MGLPCLGFAASVKLLTISLPLGITVSECPVGYTRRDVVWHDCSGYDQGCKMHAGDSCKTGRWSSNVRAVGF